MNNEWLGRRTFNNGDHELEFNRYKDYFTFVVRFDGHNIIDAMMPLEASPLSLTYSSGIHCKACGMLAGASDPEALARSLLRSGWEPRGAPTGDPFKLESGTCPGCQDGDDA